MNIDVTEKLSQYEYQTDNEKETFEQGQPEVT